MLENKSAKEVLASFSVDPERGLSAEEVKTKQAKEGPNKLQEKKSDPWYKIFWGNIADPMTLILAIAAIISLVLAILNWEKEGAEGLADVFIIFGVVLINAIIGTVQEMKAEKAFESDAIRPRKKPQIKESKKDKIPRKKVKAKAFQNTEVTASSKSLLIT